MKRPSVAHMIRQCEAFNRAVPVGSKVRVEKDDGSVLETETVGQAYILSGHTPVIMLKDIRGCYLLDRVALAGTPA